MGARLAAVHETEQERKSACSLYTPPNLGPIFMPVLARQQQGIINATPVSEIKWIPGSEHLFLAAHMDGSLVVYDKEKEDGVFTPDDESSSLAAGPQPNGEQPPSTNGTTANGEGPSRNRSDSATTNSKKHYSQIQVNKSVHSKNQKTNPVAVWKLLNQRINAFAFSPDSRHLAVVSEDGTLRVIDYLEEKYVFYFSIACFLASPSHQLPALFHRSHHPGLHARKNRTNLCSSLSLQIFCHITTLLPLN